MVINIIDDPNKYSFHYSTYGQQPLTHVLISSFPSFSSSVAMSAIYDYETQPQDDPMVKLVNDFLKASVPALTPEKAVLLKAFPFRKFPRKSHGSH